MALVALASNRSPGLTTAVTLLTCAWPLPRQAAVAELDPAGGTIAARQVVAHDPGLLSLAAAGSHGVTAPLVVEHLQRLSSGIPVLLGPPGPDRASAAMLTAAAAGLPAALGSLPGFDVLADCGRLDRSSAAMPFVEEADLCVWVARPTTEDVIGLEHRLRSTSGIHERSALVVIGDRPYRPEEVARATGLPLLGVLAWDPRSADRVADGLGPPHRSKLLRTVGEVADRMVRHLPDPPPPGTGLDDGAVARAAVPSARPRTTSPW